eukprot:14493376-Alexandrium_andersonii.AAC.1
MGTVRSPSRERVGTSVSAYHCANSVFTLRSFNSSTSSCGPVVCQGLPRSKRQSTTLTKRKSTP